MLSTYLFWQYEGNAVSGNDYIELPDVDLNETTDILKAVLLGIGFYLPRSHSSLSFKTLLLSLF